MIELIDFLDSKSTTYKRSSLLILVVECASRSLNLVGNQWLSQQYISQQSLSAQLGFSDAMHQMVCSSKPYHNILVLKSDDYGLNILIQWVKYISLPLHCRYQKFHSKTFGCLSPLFTWTSEGSGPSAACRSHPLDLGEWRTFGCHYLPTFWD